MLKPYLLIACLLLSTSACVPPPPQLSPAATRAFTNTRVVRILDLVRDTAIDANAQVPPLLATDSTRQIVQWHASALRIIQAANSGWVATVVTSLEELGKDLPAKDAALLKPYFAMAQAILKEVS